MPVHSQKNLPRNERSKKSAEYDPFSDGAARLNAQVPPSDAKLREILSRFLTGQPDKLRKELQCYLSARPDNPVALNLLAQVNVRLSDENAAEENLSHCLEKMPKYKAARFRYAKLLVRLKKFPEALSQFDLLLADDKDNPLLRHLRANLLELAGENDEALAIYKQLAEEHPHRAQSWLTYGNTLRIAGYRQDSIDAYRKALEIDSASGSAWWGLANLKTFRFGDDDIAVMKRTLKCTDLPPNDRSHIELTLGKAYEDRQIYDQSWMHYAKGNAGLRLASEPDPITATSRLTANKSLFSTSFFAERKNQGCVARDPIFIVGRMRSGSTLIEQILSSHSAIEGTAELPYIPALVNRLKGTEGETRNVGYPTVLGTLTADILLKMGEDYLARTRLHRKTARPFFIDKNPPNYFHVGLIHLILPNARIIDARRNPVATCLSIFKQGFPDLNLRLDELGRVYRDYVALMAHFDAMLPGKIHRVIYEDMVREPEKETRRLLDYLGLPFEQNCLRFYETNRAVFTPSAEQVRRPMSGDAVDQWKHYQHWLGPLIRSLGSAFTEYPDVPADLRNNI